MNTEQLSDIRTRAATATPGPWGVEPQGHDATVINRGTGVTVACCGLAEDGSAQADAEFIAAARSDVLDLADTVADLTAERTALRQEIYRLRHQLDEARADRDRYRYALRSAVGNPGDGGERMGLPAIRRLAGLDPDTGRPAPSEWPTRDQIDAQIVADVTAMRAAALPSGITVHGAMWQCTTHHMEDWRPDRADATARAEAHASRAHRTAGKDAPSLPALAVACPDCGAAAGDPCTSHGGTRTRKHDVHQARSRAYVAGD